jgi:hypothetical protein
VDQQDPQDLQVQIQQFLDQLDQQVILDPLVHLAQHQQFPVPQDPRDLQGYKAFQDQQEQQAIQDQQVQQEVKA